MDNKEMEKKELGMEELDQVAGGRKQGGYDKKPPEKPGCKIYKVVHGDTLTKIANRNNTTVKKIMAVNPELTDPGFIVSGLYIYIPM